MSNSYPRIRLYSEFEGEQHLVIRDGVSITFYMRRSHHEVRHAALEAMEAYRRATPSGALGGYIDSAGDWQELGSHGWEAVRQELLQSEGTRLILMGRPDAITGYEFTYRGRPLDSPDYVASPSELTTLSCWLPTEYLEQHGPTRVRELAMELGARLPFQSGHAGLCFHYNEDLLGMTRQLREWCFIYPGLDIPALNTTSEDMGARLDGVHWLSFLGQPVIGEVGGVAGLRSRLRAPETTVQELEGARALITLGERPVGGDQDPERALAPYRELARLLEPWLFLDRSPWRGFTPQDMRRWERRLLD